MLKFDRQAIWSASRQHNSRTLPLNTLVTQPRHSRVMPESILPRHKAWLATPGDDQCPQKPRSRSRTSPMHQSRTQLRNPRPQLRPQSQPFRWLVTDSEYFSSQRQAPQAGETASDDIEWYSRIQYKLFIPNDDGSYGPDGYFVSRARSVVKEMRRDLLHDKCGFVFFHAGTSHDFWVADSSFPFVWLWLWLWLLSSCSFAIETDTSVYNLFSSSP